MIGKHVTIYIRPDNMDKWDSIDNKSGYVNDCLSGDEDDFDRKLKRKLREMLPSVLEELRGL